MKNLIKATCILFGIAMAAPSWAIPIATVGSLDSLVANPGTTSPINSDDATEEAWVESLLGGIDVTYLSRNEGAFNFQTIDEISGAYAHTLTNTPTYFVIKIGTGGIGGPSHFLFENLSELSYAVFNLSDLGLNGIRNQNIGRISHISEFSAGSNRVPEPGTMALLAGGLVALGFASRRQQKHT